MDSFLFCLGKKVQLGIAERANFWDDSEKK